MFMPTVAQCLGLGLVLCMLAACGSSQPAVQQSATAAAPGSLVPEVPAASHETSALKCPNAVYGSRASGVRTSRGIALVFAVDDRLPARTKLVQRGLYLADMYNSVYGMEGEKTSWAKSESTRDGVRIDFSLITEPDLDERIEPIPEANEAELAELRERITGYLLTMQQERSCPLLQSLMRRGADLPPYAQRNPSGSEAP